MENEFATFPANTATKCQFS